MTQFVRQMIILPVQAVLHPQVLRPLVLPAGAMWQPVYTAHMIVPLCGRFGVIGIMSFPRQYTADYLLNSIMQSAQRSSSGSERQNGSGEYVKLRLISWSPR